MLLYLNTVYLVKLLSIRQLLGKIIRSYLELPGAAYENYEDFYNNIYLW